LLAYVRGLPEDPTAILTWRGLDGSSRPLDGAPIGGYGDVALSPDGRKVAVSLLGDTSFDIWVYDIERSIPIRLTFEGDNTGPIWTPDGRSILFYSVREGVGAAYRKAADGSGTETVVATEEGVTVLPEHISPDGRTAILSYYREFKGDLYLFPLDEDGGEATPLLIGPGDQINARFSPDGRWIAYVTDESGLFQVMVRPSSGEGGRWQISRDGGVTPRWSPDGRMLFYRNGRRLLSVAVEADAGSFRASPPQTVLDDLVRSNLAASYAVGPDGESILIAESNDAAGPPDEFTVVVNWLDELARQAPTGD
jgi:Tol biopolymer transport system component